MGIVEMKLTQKRCNFIRRVKQLDIVSIEQLPKA